MNQFQRTAPVLISVAVFLASCGSDPKPEPSADGGSAQGTGWKQIKTGGDTICALGDPYSFFVHPGKVDKVLLYFAFGGFCYNAELCRIGAPNYVPSVEKKVDVERLEHTSGIFDLKREDNPFKDWNIVYIPDCTADFGWGNTTAMHPRSGQYAPVTINHKGFVNVTAVREWVHKEFPSPEKMFVAGSSGGGDSAIMHYPYLRELYKGAPTTWVYLADASFGVVTEKFTTEYVRNWGAVENFPDFGRFAELKPEEMTWDNILTELDASYPNGVLAELGSAHDMLQTITYSIMGGPAADWPGKVEEHLANVSKKASSFRYMLASGSSHIILDQDEFYYSQVDGTTARDWVADLAEGKDVSSYHCSGTCLEEQAP